MQVASKVDTNCTYPTTANYWAPLMDKSDNDDDDDDQQIAINTINNKSNADVQRKLRETINAWINQHIRKNKPLHQKALTMILDSGATSHFMRSEENLPNMGPSEKVVMLPNGKTITASHRTNLPFETLSAKARIAEVLPALKQNSLISVGKFANANYTTVFHPNGEGVTVHKAGTFRLKAWSKPVLQGWRDANGLWRVSREQQQSTKGVRTKLRQEIAMNVYSLPSIPQTIKYLHAAAGFPVKETWVKAINNGNYSTWPGLNADAVNKHFPESVETQKGHMKKQRQNVRSTRSPVKQAGEDMIELTRTLAKHNILVKVINANQTVYSDQTGRLPVQSSRGNQLLMIFYTVDGNYINAEPMRDHSDKQMIKAYHALWERTTRKLKEKPKMHILDNEASAAFKAEIRKNCELQLVPPDTHRRNLAERAIQTFKSHFISVLAGVDPTFPMSLWDRLLPQTVLTLNLQRQAHASPTTSAYEYINGPFDYNKMPLAPLGCKVQIHESTNRRKTWDPRALNGWYLGTSSEHYRCHIIFCQKTRSERISDTVFFQHRYITQPTVTPEDQIVKAVVDLTAALKQRANTQGKAEMESLQRLCDIINNVKPSSKIKRSVTCKDPIPESRVERCSGDMQQSHNKTTPTPRVIVEPSPRVSVQPVEPSPWVIVQPVVNKPMVNSKPMRTATGCGPTT